MKTRRKFMAAVALAAAATPLGALLNPASAAENKVQLMFVQSAESIKADAKTLRLVNVAPQTIYFSDRPERKRRRCASTWPSASPGTFRCRTI